MTAGLAIRRYRARLPAQAEPVAARLALQALAADLEDAVPRSLPPQALLWLRRVSVQLPPGALRRVAAARGLGVAQGREQIDAALARAVRPAVGPVPPDAEAVLFADEAEMLACLALAAQAGQLDRWWWRGLLGIRWPAWQAAWAERPWATVAARRLLARAGLAQVVVGLTGQGAGADDSRSRPAADMTRAIAVVGVPDVAPAGPLAMPRHAARAGPAADAAPERATGDDARVVPSGATLDPVPLAVAPPAREASSPAVGASAAPGPFAPVRAAPVPRHETSEDTAREPAADTRAEAMRPASYPDNPEPAPMVADAERAAWSATAPPSADEIPAMAPRDAVRPVAMPQEAHRVAAPPGDGPAAMPAPGVDPVPAPRPARPHPAPPALASDPPPVSDDAPVAWPWPQACLSHLGPLLFLVNALLEDGLYPDFTQPRDPGLPVPLWALLGALAQAWRLPPDPLQALLAEQAGGWRPDQLSGDLPAVPGVAAGPWAAWLPAYARRLRGRLCRRLGLPPRRWAAALHRPVPGRLWVSAGAWELALDLADHDVAWRLAGLDRDPGWLPSVDISLRFRFT